MNITGSLTHVTALGIFFGAVGLAIGAATSKSIAVGASASLAIVADLPDQLLGISDISEPFAALSPWYYSSDPEAIINGANWGFIAVFAALTAVAVYAATQLFERREITA